jgi:hypothetical protein
VATIGDGSEPAADAAPTADDAGGPAAGSTVDGSGDADGQEPAGD